METGNFSETDKLSSEDRSRLLSALLRRAIGYTTVERTVERSGADGENEKCRETVKEVPGDVSAAKLLFELEGKTVSCYGSMTDEQLLGLRNELSAKLDEILQNAK